MGRGIAGFRGMAGIVDTHTHLKSFVRAGRLEEALGSALDAGVERLVTVGTGSDDWELYAQLASERAEVDYTVGMHPCSVEDGWEAAAASIEGFWSREKPPAALGEIGLDRFHLPKDSALAERAFARQLAAFEGQLGLARRMQCPVVIHSRGAFADTAAIVEDFQDGRLRGIFHCFTEDAEAGRRAIDAGFLLGLGGVLTFNKSHALREAVAALPREAVVLETDSPYLAPQAKRGRRNEPAYVQYVAETLAEVWGTSVAEALRITSNNACRLFRLPVSAGEGR